MFTLMACKKEGSGLSGDNIDVNATTTTKSITLKYTLPANDNIKKGNILDLSKKLGGEKLNKKISFMTSHSALYPKLKDDTLSQQRMLEIENEINQNSIYYIPKSKIQNISAKIKSGNLIFITTATEGLDFAHVGIAINENGVLKMIHASSSAKKVVKTPTSLSEYLKGMKNFTGISVAEVL